MILYRIDRTVASNVSTAALIPELIEVGVLVEVEPTVRIRWCFAHDQELGKYLSVCDDEWKRNERSLRMGVTLQKTCDIGDALLVRVPKEET